MDSNNLFHDRYFLERLLGRGNFSEVWLAKDIKTDIEVALKIYAPATGLDDHGLNVLSREFALVVNANHKNLLKPLYYDSFDRKPYLILPYCKRGSILKDVGKFSEKDAWRLLRDVASGLACLHSMNPIVVHQDIKPDNIMVDEKGNYVITDFGVSSHIRSTLRKSMSLAFVSAGTTAYMAPERFSADNTPIMANDIYSLGVTVYEMITGDLPFGEDGGLLQKRGAEIPQLKGKYSEQFRKVLTMCLQEKPWNRPTAEQLEGYAQVALNGGKISFSQKKMSFVQHKKLWIGGIAAVLLLLIGCITMFTIKSCNSGTPSELEMIPSDTIAPVQVEMADTVAVDTIAADTIPAKNLADEKANGTSRQKRKKNIVQQITEQENTIEQVTITKPYKDKEGENIQLSVSPTELVFKAKGDETKHVYIVVSNGHWEVRGVPAWLTSVKKGQELILVSQKNESGKNRTATITIVAQSKEQSVTIRQKTKFKLFGKKDNDNVE